MTLLRTPRLVLAPMGETELEAWHDLNMHPRVRRYLFDDLEWTRDETRERLFDVNRRLWREEGLGLFGVWEGAGSPLVGWCGFWYFHEPPVRELAYALHPGVWGIGYAVEASRAVLRFGRDVHGDTAFRASTDAPNAASLRVLARLGFHQTGRTAGVLGEIVHLVRPGCAGLDDDPSGGPGPA